MLFSLQLLLGDRHVLIRVQVRCFLLAKNREEHQINAKQQRLRILGCYWNKLSSI